MMFFLRIEDGLFLVKSDPGGELKRWTAAALDGRTRGHSRHLGRETEAHADRFAEQQSREKDPVAESKGFEPANAKGAVPTFLASKVKTRSACHNTCFFF